jgi:adenine-specific DNA-methyltransferase
MTIWKYAEVGHSQDASQKLKKLFDGKAFFDYPKPVDLIKRCIQLYTEKEDFILDFFSGSATTAHAVMQLNAEDGGHRKFIMVQLPEATDEKSEAYKAGYKTICEIGKERIRRAGKKIKDEWQIGSGFEQLGMDSAHWQTEIMEAGEPAVKDLDIGFRVLKLDSSNMKDVYYTPAKTTRTLFESLADNIKEDRTPEDLLFQVMLDLGILLSSKIEERTVAGKRVFSVNDDYLLACFDNDLTDEVIEEMASLHPYYVVTRDSSMASDSVKTSFEQILLSHGIKSNEWKVL